MLYEVESVRRFTGIRCTTVPAETTILNFRQRISIATWISGLNGIITLP